MIFFGLSKENTTDTQLIPFEACSNCGAKDTSYVTSLIRYAHIYWIPLVPSGKRLVIFCTECKRNYNNANGLSSQGKAFCDEFEEKQTHPIYYWTLALVILGIGAFMLIRFLIFKITLFFS